MFKGALYISLIISVSGVIFQLHRFRKDGQFFNRSKNENHIKSFFHIREFLLNTFLQTKLFKAGKIRWGFHFLLFLSFLYLVIVHALHDVTSSVLFKSYDPTVDPYQFLRNLTGLMVLTGCVAFLFRRRFNIRSLQDKSIKHKGVFSIILILLLVCSGFLLESSKIISEPVFMEMVEEYSDLDEETGLSDLKLFWKDNYNVVFTENIKTTSNGLEKGRLLNEEYCLSCHSNIKSAFISNTLAKTISNAGNILNQYRIDTKFYVIHYMLCLSLLICLPFSRLFHVLLIPFASSRQNLTLDSFLENKAFINIASLYACTNCGYCSRVCSVYPNFQITGNQDVLPHWKIESVKTMMQNPGAANWWRLHAGNDECTMCRHCTDICPSGIDLQSLWSVLDKKLVTMGYTNNTRFILDTSLKEWAKKEEIYTGLIPGDALSSNLADRTEAFENCIQCSICTNVCPIVDYDSNQNDITPQQVMNLLRLGKKHLATGTRMVWTCLTCYSCQEHCPKEIRVADILLELRNAGSNRADMIQQRPIGLINR